MKKLLSIFALIFATHIINANDETKKIIPLFTVNQRKNIFTVINSVTKKEVGFTHKEQEAYKFARQLNVAYTQNKNLSQEDINAITLGWITNNGRKKQTCTIL